MNTSLTKTQHAFREIRRAIEEGGFKPSTPLTIRQLTQWLDMSPTPIREALRLLEAQGLVEYRPHYGMVVAKLSSDRVHDVYQLRAVLEPLATKLAVEAMEDDDVAAIEKLHRRLVEYVDDEHPDAAALNAEWHQAIYSRAPSALLNDFIKRLWTAVPFEGVWRHQRAEQAVHHHSDVMQALSDRDGEKAANLMRAHIEWGGQTLIERLQQLGDG